MQKLEEDVARLSLQNSELKARLEEGGDGTDKASGSVAQMALLQYRISQLQNNEKLLVHKRGLLETRCVCVCVRVCEVCVCVCVRVRCEG